jgi:hypothetical protein
MRVRICELVAGDPGFEGGHEFEPKMRPVPLLASGISSNMRVEPLYE